MVPLPSPPFHQISFPDDPVPARKLHAVRFSTYTSSAFQIRIPLRPTALPSGPTAPKFCAAGLELQADDPALVPSTITVDRFIPRRWMSGVVISTPPVSPSEGSVWAPDSSAVSW